MRGFILKHGHQRLIKWFNRRKSRPHPDHECARAHVRLLVCPLAEKIRDDDNV